MFCKKCGEPVDDTDNFCGKCGQPVIRQSSDKATPTQVKQSEPQGATAREASSSQTHSKQHEESEKEESFIGRGVKFISGVFNKKDTKTEIADSELRVLLVGHTGHGKSATGNSLIGREAFKHSRRHASVTKTCHRQVGIRFRTQLDIIDTPGFFDTSHDDTFVHEELSKCVALTIPGFNAIFFVLKPDRFSEEIVNTVDIFFKFFGETVDNYAFLILTFTKNNKQKEEYLEAENEQHAKLVELVKRCKNKVLFIDNDVGQFIRDQFVQQIIKEVKEANGKLEQPYFSNDTTKKVEEHAISYNKKHGYGKVSKSPKKDGKTHSGRDQEPASPPATTNKTSKDEGLVTPTIAIAQSVSAPATASVPESTTVTAPSVTAPATVSVTQPTYQAPITNVEEIKANTSKLEAVSTAQVTPTVVNVHKLDSSGNVTTEKMESKLASSQQVINITVQCEPKSSNSAAQYEEYKKAVETDKEVQKSLTDIVVETAGSAIRYVSNKVTSWFSSWFK